LVFRNSGLLEDGHERLDHVLPLLTTGVQFRFTAVGGALDDVYLDPMKSS
jgi:hypothetical protein